MTASGSGRGTGTLAEEVARLIEAICLMAGLRQLRPEVVEHLAAAGEELLAAAREFVASSSGPNGSAAPDGGPGDEPDGDVRPARTVERIELD